MSKPMHTPRLNCESLEARDVPAALAISDVTLFEQTGFNPRALFTVTLSEPATGTVTVNYQTANGTAVAGKDYVAAAGTLTFAPGETTKTISVEIVGDTKNESDETFAVNLSGAVNALIGDGSGVGTILNDDSHNGGGGGNSCKPKELC